MSVQRRAWEEPSASSSSYSSTNSYGNPLIHQWGYSEGNFASLQHSIEARLKELEAKEAQVNDRLRELESREREATAELDPGQGSTDAKKLLSLLGESAGERERLRDRLRRALGESEDPGRAVLEALGELCGEGFGSGGKPGSAVVLLEQLAEAGPRIGPAERAEAARLAREWRARIRDHSGGGVSEVLGFLLLVAAYDLLDEFDGGDVFGVFRSIGRRSVGDDKGVELGLGDDFDQDLASKTPASQEKPDRSLEEDLELVNQIASAFTSTFEALKCFCVGMDGRNLKLFLYQYVEEHDSWSTEVREALWHAPDPAKLVLQAIPGFLRSQPEFHKRLNMAKVRKICILLLEQLMTISPPINPNVKEEALKLAGEWGSNLGQVYQRPVTVYGFLLFLAAYRLGSSYDTDELLRLLGIASQYKAFPGLCHALGLADEVLIQSLIQKTMLLEAVDNVYAYGLVDKFQPVRLLKGYLNYSRKRIYKKADQSSSQQKQAINKEIATIKTVIKYIAKYKLESTYPPGGLEKQISQLENKKGKINDPAESKKPKADRKSNVLSPSVSCASIVVDSQPKSESSLKEDLQSDNQVAKSELSPKAELLSDSEMVKTEKSLRADSNVGNQAPLPSTSPWPRLESFYVSLYGKGFNFFSHKLKEGPNSVVSLSSPASPWPEIKSFCVNMDGKGLRTFVYHHMDENESFCSEVCDALKHASDPAKLVLDTMPGCLRSQPEFDESLNKKKVRNSRILLLEQLITISPQIGPLLKEEALKMANEWRANLGLKFKAPDNVYGFLHFIAAYGLVSDFEAEELIGLLGPANQHKVSPDLCHILGFADKALVVINNLIQMSLVVEAIEHIYAFWMVDEFSPALLLKDYLNSNKARKDGTKPHSKKAIEHEIAAVRSVIKCVTKYKLESELPPEELERKITELEKQKPRVHDPVKVTSARNVQA